MPISTTCRGCGKTIAAPDSAAGHKAKCPQCGSVVEIPVGAPAGLAAAVSAKTAPAVAADLGAGGPATGVRSEPSTASVPPSSVRTPTPSAVRSGATTVDRLLARTSPYGSLRLMAAITFGAGVTAAVLVFLAGLTALVIISTRGRPDIGIGAFLGALALAGLLVLGSKVLAEVLRLAADVGDRARQMTHMLEEAISRSRDTPL